MSSFEAEYKTMSIKDIEGHNFKTRVKFLPCLSSHPLREMGCTDLVVQLTLGVTPEITVQPLGFPYIVLRDVSYEYIGEGHRETSRAETVKYNCNTIVDSLGLPNDDVIKMRVHQVGTNARSFDSGLIPHSPRADNQNSSIELLRISKMKTSLSPIIPPPNLTSPADFPKWTSGRP